jgi:hypothetical protein
MRAQNETFFVRHALLSGTLALNNLALFNIGPFSAESHGVAP